MLVALPKKSSLHVDFPQARFALLVMSAVQRVDWGTLRKALGRKTSLASPEAVWSVAHCLSGAVPPFGSLFSAQGPASEQAQPSTAHVVTLLDPSLVEQGTSINFNAGLRTDSLGMSVSDYLAVESPLQMPFTAAS